MCKDNIENSFTTKVGEHVPFSFSLSTISSFKSIEKKYDIYKGEDYMKKPCESLKEHTFIDD